jgi:hypothetical protein
MIWPVLLFSIPLLAQNELSAIQKLGEKLPNYQDQKQLNEEVVFKRQIRKSSSPKRIISYEEILKSGTQFGAVQAGARLIDNVTNKSLRVTKLIYVEYFNLQDENGFKYLKDKNGVVNWRIAGDSVEPIKQEIDLYVPPHKYEPAIEIVSGYEDDKKLTIPPEFSFYAGVVQGDFMKDLFDDNKARSGFSNQYGIHFFTEWKLPVKAGAVVHYEKSSYSLDNGGQAIYSAISLGPQFKTRDYDILGKSLRLQAQFRVGPFAQARAETTNGVKNFKFNSADLLVSIEHPIENRFGQFLIGLFSQTQWLNLREQPVVRVKATNETNKSIGILFSQVFQ